MNYLIKLVVGGGCLLTGAVLGSGIGATILTSVSGSCVANDIENFVKGKFAQVSLENHDLVKAIGKAIGEIIATVAQEPQFKDYKSNLLRIAKKAEENWLIIAEKIPDLSSNNIPDFIQQNYNNAQDFSLNLEEWKDIFIRLNLKTFKGGGETFPSKLITDIAQKLQDTFTSALTEVLKHDFAHDGKAYAGLTLKLLTGIKAQLDQNKDSEILVKLDQLVNNLSTNNDEIINKSFQEISNNMESNFTLILDKLDIIDSKIDMVVRA